MRVALAQINTTIADFAGNLRRIRDALQRGADEGVDLVLFPEMTICGYPARDLLEDASFLDANRRGLEIAVAATKGAPAALIGFAERTGRQAGRTAHNSAALCVDGAVSGVYRKTLLPTYDVFDEERHFEPNSDPAPIEFGDGPIAVTICEDLWNDPQFWPEPIYVEDPVTRLVEANPRVILNLSASPWIQGKGRLRFDMVRERARREGIPVAYCNQVGGNDELVFDGASFAVDGAGRLLGRAASFAEDFLVVDLDAEGEEPDPPTDDRSSDVRAALVLGLRDYLRKCGFPRVVVGLSGGVDSAVTAALAVEAIGAENVLGVSMPSRYSSQGSLDDAADLAERLGIERHVVSIEPVFESFLETLTAPFGDEPVGVTAENLQARIRGDLLMAFSNEQGSLLLSTGNKSEHAVGYCTLYGDMNGGLALLSDVPKTLVYAVADEINAAREVIPRASIEKPPSAELAHGQRDEDSLPPYVVLDEILRRRVEDHEGEAEIVAAGFDAGVVRRVFELVDRNEYKRRQAPPGIKVTSKAFGSGRRIPIAKRWRPPEGA